MAKKKCPAYVEGEDTIPLMGKVVRWEWPQYREEQERVWMTPEEYLKLVPSPGYWLPTSYKEITELMTKGTIKGKKEDFLSPYLEVEETGCRVQGHEGRHRAYWFYNQGIPCMPVLLTHWHKNRHVTVTKKCAGKLKPDLDILKPRVGSALEAAKRAEMIEL
jgi:hypothetical protein